VRTLWSALKKSPAALAGLSIILSVTILAALSVEIRGESILTRHLLRFDPHEEDRGIGSPPSPPDSTHWLGTDVQRRDLLSRLLHGSRISIQVGLAAEAIALLIGVIFGLAAGFYRGWIDSLLMRAADILLAFPLPIMAMAAMAVFDTRSITVVFLILGLMGWAGIARLVRSRCISISGGGYPEAARALGAGDFRLMLRHVLPNAWAPALVAASVGVSGNILTEAWLSFLGLGVQYPAVSWGLMIVDARPYLTRRPELFIFPGLALMITVLGFILLADGLRDALDPKSRLATQT
jgi:ABC-type dipeptide/oligopeptide/nickel transport system permease subunit